jgi:hypothetical protein
MKQLTKKDLEAKLLQVAQFEQKYGECTESRAMRKFCTDPVYRDRVREFNKASANSIVGYEKYK